MSNARLFELLATMEQMEKEMNSMRLAVWDELERVQPQVASEVLSLFTTREAAALWVTSSRNGHPSPARRFVDGNVEELVTNLRRAVHGISA